jgi:S1-C subfamily serine protease
MSEYDQPPATTRQSSNLNWLVFFLLLLVGVLVLRTLYPSLSPLMDPTAAARAVTPRGDLAEDEKATIEIFREASPSVVHITTFNQVVNDFKFDDSQTQGFGSGFIWSEEGYVVTNYHVLQNSGGAKVTLANGTTHTARFVGGSPDFDLAVLKIDVPSVKLKPLLVGESANLEVGQKVFAIGNPFGLDQTLTTGVIGGLGRQIRSISNHPIQGVIQTDAAINPGNSGGPLLDSAGRLIGVNTMIYSPNGTSAGIGYAVPVDTVNRVVPQLISTGQVERPVLGIAIWADATVKYFVREKTLPREGVLVLAVPPSSSDADSDKLRPTTRSEDGTLILGDLIVGFNDRDIKDSSDLYAALDERKIGEVVTLKIIRGAQEHQIKLKLRSPNTTRQLLSDDDIPDPTDPDDNPDSPPQE